MMRPRLRSSLFALSLAIAGTFAACRSATPAGDADSTPSLVVMLVVDQLGGDLLARYEDVYSDGLRRLLDEGHRFDNAAHDHASTSTAPGHTTLSTGVHPARHGIVGNSWSVREGDGWRSEYALEQLESAVLGLPDLPGRGPENVLRDGLPNWILAEDPDAKVVSVSGKDRAAIGLAARAPGHVYWLERYTGQFVTSEHYRTRVPDWVSSFNRDDLPALYGDTLWTSEVPPSLESRSRPDSSRYEVDREHTAFPHSIGELVDASDPAAANDWRYTYTPFTDRAVTAFAIRAVEEEELGQRGPTDYLGVALSAVDLVGHRFGPGSREQLDNLLRLDRELGRLFRALDQHVGAGRWVLAMSADHGVLEIPEELRDRGVDADRLTPSDRNDLLAALEGARFAGDGSREAAKAAVLELPFVEASYTFDEIESGQASDSFAVLFRNSHSSTRIVQLEGRAGIYARLAPNVLRWGAGPATHGSAYRYDRHVPLVFLGAGVRAGRSTASAATVDAAPTLGALAGIAVPGDVDGQVLEPALSR